MFVLRAEVMTVNILFLRKKKKFIFICVRHLCVDARRDQKRKLDPLELELLTVVSLVWVLRTKLESSGRIVGTLNP